MVTLRRLQFPLKVHISSYFIPGDGNLAKLNNTCSSGQKKNNVNNIKYYLEKFVTSTLEKSKQCMLESFLAFSSRHRDKAGVRGWGEECEELLCCHGGKTPSPQRLLRHSTELQPQLDKTSD